MVAMLRSLPPSERNFEIYGAVVVEGMSTRAAATAFGLPQTRIVQIRDHVAHWIAAHLPTVRQLPPAQRVALAAEIAEKRLDHLYAEALEAWRQSQGDQSIRRTGSQGEMLITRESPGDVRVPGHRGPNCRARREAGPRRAGSISGRNRRR